jgi:hypothetical protein
VYDKKLWKEQVNLPSAEGQPTRAVLAQSCVGEFFLFFSLSHGREYEDYSLLG